MAAASSLHCDIGFRVSCLSVWVGQIRPLEPLSDQRVMGITVRRCPKQIERYCLGSWDLRGFTVGLVQSISLLCLLERMRGVVLTRSKHKGEPGVLAHIGQRQKEATARMGFVTPKKAKMRFFFLVWLERGSQMAGQGAKLAPLECKLHKSWHLRLQLLSGRVVIWHWRSFSEGSLW